MTKRKNPDFEDGFDEDRGPSRHDDGTQRRRDLAGLKAWGAPC